MIHLPDNFQILFAANPCDFRKSFNGLCGIIINEYRLDPLTRSLFVFFNKRRDSIKILTWDTDGFLLVYKKLEKGTFKTFRTDSKYCIIESYQLQMILQGIEYNQLKKRVRYKLIA